MGRRHFEGTQLQDRTLQDNVGQKRREDGVLAE